MTRAWFVRRTTWVAGVLLLVVGMAGCTQFIYNRLDTMAALYLGNLVTLDVEQRDDLKAWLEQTLEWHRASELARYAQFLRELARELAAPASRATYEQAQRQVEAFAADLLARAAPQASELLTSLTDQQVTELLDSLEQKSQQRAKKQLEHIAADSWHAQRTRDIQRQLKRWTGAVTAQQKLTVSELVAQLQPATPDWLQSQRRWRAALREATRGSPAPVNERILALLRQPDSEWTAEYRAKFARNREQILSLLQALDATLTPAQRRHLRSELEELAEQLETLKEN